MSRTLCSIFMLLLSASNAFAQTKPQVSFGNIQRLENFQSQYVDGRNVDIWLPDGFTSNKKYPVLYMHDGQMLYDASTT